MIETVEVLGLLNVQWQNLHFNSEKINGKSTYLGAVAREKYEKRSLSSLHGLWMHAEKWRVSWTPVSTGSSMDKTWSNYYIVLMKATFSCSIIAHRNNVFISKMIERGLVSSAI